MSQREQILKHLNEKGSITPLDALRYYGCLRLSARIYELRKDGHDIRDIGRGKHSCYHLVTVTPKQPASRADEQ